MLPTNSQASQKSAPWNDIINHRVVVICNGDKSFQTARQSVGPKQRCCTRKIASERYVLLLLLFRSLIDFINFDLRDLPPVAFTVRCLRAFFLIWLQKDEEMILLSALRIISSAILRGVVSLIKAAALFIHFIWIFHLKLISKIVQLHYRVVVHSPPLPLNQFKFKSTSALRWGKTENWL